MVSLILFGYFFSGVLLVAGLQRVPLTPWKKTLAVVVLLAIWLPGLLVLGRRLGITP